MILHQHKTQAKQPIAWVFFATLLLPLAALQGHAQQLPEGFAGGVTPTRFELSAKPGEVLRESFTIYNTGARPEVYTVQSNDWTFSETGALGFSFPLLENSCRRWIKLERHQLKVLPGSTRARRFRFEVHVPETAQPGECRFALMVGSSAEPVAHQIAPGIALPTTGRVAIIVYLNIGDAQPNTRIEDFTTTEINGQRLPAVVVSNTGVAHDRLGSRLQAADSAGRQFLITVSNTPILPNQRRLLSMHPSEVDDGYRVQYPVHIKGRIFTKADTLDIDEIISAPTATTLPRGGDE